MARAGGAEDGRAVVAAMKAMPNEDPLFGRGVVRQDGRKIHPVRLMEAKGPAEATGEWDFFEQVGTVPAEDAHRPSAESRCPPVQGQRAARRLRPAPALRWAARPATRAASPARPAPPRLGVPVRAA